MVATARTLELLDSLPVETRACILMYAGPAAIAAFHDMYALQTLLRLHRHRSGHNTTLEHAVVPECVRHRWSAGVEALVQETRSARFCPTTPDLEAIRLSRDTLEIVIKQTGSTSGYLPIVATLLFNVFDADAPDFTLALQAQQQHSKFNTYFQTQLVRRGGDLRLLQLACTALGLGDPFLLVQEAAGCGCIDLLPWLRAHFERSEYGRTLAEARTLTHDAARNGHFDTLRWFRAEWPDAQSFGRAMDAAAGAGQLQILQWLQQDPQHTCSAAAMDRAAQNGHLPVLEFLHAHCGGMCTRELIVRAARHGHLHILSWTFDTHHVERKCDAPMDACKRLHAFASDHATLRRAMQCAAENGHLAVIQLISPHTRQLLCPQAMDTAAMNGHLAVVEWLHTHRTDGCTAQAMDGAAGQGHLHVVEWLHAHRAERCTVHAMNNAAAGNHLNVVKWLHQYRSEGCSEFAVTEAAANGHLRVVRWLVEHYPEHCTPDAIVQAACHLRSSIVQYLVQTLPPELVDQALAQATAQFGPTDASMKILARYVPDRALR
ncbi:hypothetical protein RI367_003817 [Sorochytrium milnesiophthora]